MQLHKRLEKLEAKTGPIERRTVHIVGVDPGQSYEEARACHWASIADEDEVIFLVGFEPPAHPDVGR